MVVVYLIVVVVVVDASVVRQTTVAHCQWNQWLLYVRVYWAAAI